MYVGGGIIGCTTAYYLTHHPHFDPSVHAVTLIEGTKLANGAWGKLAGYWLPGPTQITLPN